MGTFSIRKEVRNAENDKEKFLSFLRQKIDTISSKNTIVGDRVEFSMIKDTIGFLLDSDATAKIEKTKEGYAITVDGNCSINTKRAVLSTILFLLFLPIIGGVLWMFVLIWYNSAYEQRIKQKIEKTLDGLIQ